MLSMENRLIQDLIAAVGDEDMMDLTLVGFDSIPVSANRFVLGARSAVFKRMLYGNFKEATRQEIVLNEYDSVTLEAVVEYCCRNTISKFRLYLHRDYASARKLVRLYQAADYLELNGLSLLVRDIMNNLVSRYPPLACAVLDEADHALIVHEAHRMITCRPYATLPPHPETGGGIDCLSETKLIRLYQDPDIQAGEMFLFQMLQQWTQLTSHPNPQQVAANCAKFLKLEYMDPPDLVGKVQQSGLVQMEAINKAITEQALRASYTRVWSLSCRGPNVERILVEGAGCVDANGLYYRIEGLANGELYSKREVTCGQQHVYTLSCSVNSDTVECRIFSSKLLTHCAVPLMVHRLLRKKRGPNFHPLVQVFKIDEADECDHADPVSRILSTTSSQLDISTTAAASARSKLGPASKKSKLRILVSDGEYYVIATMAQELSNLIRSKEIVPNTLLKLLEWEKKTISATGSPFIHIQKVSIISQNPGHSFGNPLDVEQVDELHPEALICPSSLLESNVNWVPPPDYVVTGSQQGGDSSGGEDISPTNSNDSNHNRGGTAEAAAAAAAATTNDNNYQQGLLKLYSIQYPINEKPVDSKIPRAGWKVEADGAYPSPSCRWIPVGTSASPSSASGGKSMTTVATGQASEGSNKKIGASSPSKGKKRQQQQQEHHQQQQQQQQQQLTNPKRQEVSAQ